MGVSENRILGNSRPGPSSARALLGIVFATLVVLTVGSCSRGGPSGSLGGGDTVRLANGVQVACPSGWTGMFLDGTSPGNLAAQLLVEKMPEGLKGKLPDKIQEVSFRPGNFYSRGDTLARDTGDQGDVEITVYRPRSLWLKEVEQAHRVSKRSGWNPTPVALRLASTVQATVTASSITGPSEDGSGLLYVDIAIDLQDRDPVQIRASVTTNVARSIGATGTPAANVNAIVRLLSLKLP